MGQEDPTDEDLQDAGDEEEDGCGLEDPTEEDLQDDGEEEETGCGLEYSTDEDLQDDGEYGKGEEDGCVAFGKDDHLCRVLHIGPTLKIMPMLENRQLNV